MYAARIIYQAGMMNHAAPLAPNIITKTRKGKKIGRGPMAFSAAQELLLCDSTGMQAKWF